MRVSLITLGCKVSQYDSAQLERMILGRGGEVVPPSPHSEAFLICGCAVTDKAVKEAKQVSRRLRRLNPRAPVILYGCIGELAHRSGEENAFPPRDKEGVLLKLGLKGKAEDALPSWHRTRGVVKVQDGCDRFCSFCIVPHLRGKPQSRKLEEVIKEVEELSRVGFKEVVLTGVHLSSYGKDLHESLDIFSLLEALEKIPGIERIRLSSMEPVDLDREKINRLGRISKLCPHFHLPLQSGSDRILKSMNRGYTLYHYLSLVDACKSTWPDPAITTDIMVGFPGETEEDFQLTLKALETVGFARIHAFRYSPRPFTLAENFPDQVEDKVKRERMVRLRLMASKLSLAYQEKFLGKVLPVLLEELFSPNEGEGYTPNYIRVKVQSEEPLACNTIVPVRIYSITDICLGETI
jgi:threonylcarbamoyladenosine tRNA methylthiotransferase MtaB